MTLPPPDDSTVRALRREDAAVVAEILAEDEHQFGLPGQIGPQDINAWWMRTDLEHDSWVLEDSGAPVAGGWLDRLAALPPRARDADEPGAELTTARMALVARSEGDSRVRVAERALAPQHAHASSFSNVTYTLSTCMPACS